VPPPLPTYFVGLILRTANLLALAGQLLSTYMKFGIPAFTLCLLLLFLTPAAAQTPGLLKLVYTRQYPQLARALETNSQNLDNASRTFYQAVLWNAFGETWKSRKALDKLLRSGQSTTLPDSVQFWMHKVQYDNFVKLFNYRQADVAATLLLTRYRAFLTPAQVEDETEAQKIWYALRAVPVQKMRVQGDARVPLTRDKAHLWNVPVDTGDSTYQFVFDTGAGISVIAESYARKLHLRRVDAGDFRVKSGVTGIATPAGLGIADELRLPNITVYHAAFLIFPDSALTFGNGVYAIRGIIGCPIIKEFPQFVLSEQELLIPRRAVKPSQAPNLYLDMLKPVFYLTYHTDELPFTFDSGAQETLLSEVFYQRYRNTSLVNATEDQQQVGGVGGTSTLRTLQLPVILLKSNDLLIPLPLARVNKDPVPNAEGIYYGNLGQDIIRQFQRLRMDFHKGFFQFEQAEPHK
jgi:hypothetical protein